MPDKDQDAARLTSRERSRRKRADNPGYSTFKNQKWQTANREKYLAHKAVANALVAGKLSKLPCEVCLNERSEAHHEDYSRQLDVNWLCRTHHLERHRLTGKD